jgi:hypothetical protein
MRKNLLLIGLGLLAASSAVGDEPPKAKQPPVVIRQKHEPGAPFPPRYRVANNPPPHLLPIVVPLDTLDALRYKSELRFWEIRKQYSMGDNYLQHVLHRWDWLAAKRAAIRDLDRSCIEAARLEADYYKFYNASPDPGKEFYHSDRLYFGQYYATRIRTRYEWWYIAMMHHWRWEKDRPGGPLNYRLEKAICRAVGCKTEEFVRFLAWVDLFAAELLPRHMSLWLTIPLSLLS